MRCSAAGFALLWANLTFVLATSDVSTRSSATITSAPSDTQYSNRTSASHAGTCRGYSCYFVSVKLTTYSWSKYITPVVVGTAMVIIDPATNRTTTTTEYNTLTSSFIVNGTVSTLHRATAPKTANHSSTIVTFPYPWYDSLGVTFLGILPNVSATTTTCTTYPNNRTGSILPLPTHVPWPTTIAENVDTDDPYGDTYTLLPAVGAGQHPGLGVLSYTDILTYFPNDKLLQAIYTECGPGINLQGPATATGVGALIVTSTTTLPSSASPSPTSAQAVSTTTAHTTSVLPTSAQSTSTIMIASVTSSAAPSTTSVVNSSSVAALSELVASAVAVSGSSSSTVCIGAACFAVAQPSTKADTTSPPAASPKDTAVSSSSMPSTTHIPSLEATNVAPSTAKGSDQVTASIQTTSVKPAFSLGSTIITQDASNSQYNIGSYIYTMIQGGPPVTADGTMLSLASHGSALIINGLTTNHALQPGTSTTDGNQEYSMEGSGSVRTLLPLVPSSSSQISATVPSTGIGQATSSQTSMSSRQTQSAPTAYQAAGHAHHCSMAFVFSALLAIYALVV